MKTNIFLIASLLLSASVFAQTPLRLVKERVGNPDILKNWEVGETKYVNEASIQRTEGANNYDFITNIFYTPASTIHNLVAEKAESEGMTAAAKEELVGCYESAVPGGQVALFFSRPTRALAEPANFGIQVVDENGTVLWTEMLQKEQPFYYRWEIWYYYKTINLPVAVGERFSIRVYDAGVRKNYKFSVRVPDNAQQQSQPDLSLKQNSF